MIVATLFTNFGPYHLARLRSLAKHLHARGDELLAYEVASGENCYPWSRSRQTESFTWITLFPTGVLEKIPAGECVKAVSQALDRDRPDVLAVAGYARPESLAAARWGRKNRRPTILMSESQWIDRPRTWWKELVKKRRIELFDAALVGGRSHAEYLAMLGMKPESVSFGYNAVDNMYFRDRASFWRERGPDHPPAFPAPFFLSVCRFVPEKNLLRLIDAYDLYRRLTPGPKPWDLVLCGDGPQWPIIQRRIRQSEYSESIHCPGFLQLPELTRLYADAAAFVLPSLSEPWGLVANEAASAGLPLLISQRAGCSNTLAPRPLGSTGAQFDPLDTEQIASRLAWISSLSDAERHAMGERAMDLVNLWGPDRFGQGMLEAVARVTSG